MPSEKWLAKRWAKGRAVTCPGLEEPQATQVKQIKPPARRKAVKHKVDYECMHRGTTPLSKYEKEMFVGCNGCGGPPVFRCEHPELNEPDGDEPHQAYCTIYAPLSDRSVLLCRRCEDRETSD